MKAKNYIIMIGLGITFLTSSIPFVSKTNYIYKGNIFDSKQVGNYMHFIIEQQNDFYQDSVNIIDNPIMKNLEIGDSLGISINKKRSPLSLTLEELTGYEEETFKTKDKYTIEITKKYPVFEDIKRI